MQTLTIPNKAGFLSQTTHPLNQDTENQYILLHPFAQYIGGKKHFFTVTALSALFPPLLGVFLYKKLYTQIYLDLEARCLLSKTPFGGFERLADLQKTKRVELILKENRYFGQSYEVAVHIMMGERQRRVPLLVFAEFSPACEFNNLLLEWTQEQKA